MRNLGSMYFQGEVHGGKNTILAEQFFKMADNIDRERAIEAKGLIGKEIHREDAPAHPSQRELPAKI